MAVRVRSRFDVGKGQDASRNVEAFGSGVPFGIDVGSNWGDREGQIRKGSDHLTQDYFSRKRSPGFIATDFCEVAPPVAINVAVKDAAAHQCGRIRFGKIVGIESDSEEFKRVDVPLALREISRMVMSVAAGDVTSVAVCYDQIPLGT